MPNTHRVPKPELEPGDGVCLNARNIEILRPAVKLHHRQLLPFAETEKIRLSAYYLWQSTSIMVHSVFHISFLELAA